MDVKIQRTEKESIFKDPLMALGIAASITLILFCFVGCGKGADAGTPVVAPPQSTQPTTQAPQPEPAPPTTTQQQPNDAADEEPWGQDDVDTLYVINGQVMSPEAYWHFVQVQYMEHLIREEQFERLSRFRLQLSISQWNSRLMRHHRVTKAMLYEDYNYYFEYVSGAEFSSHTHVIVRGRKTRMPVSVLYQRPTTIPIYRSHYRTSWYVPHSTVTVSGRVWMN